MHPNTGGSTMGGIRDLLEGKEGWMKMLPARKCLTYDYI